MAVSAADRFFSAVSSAARLSRRPVPRPVGTGAANEAAERMLSVSEAAAEKKEDAAPTLIVQKEEIKMNG